MAPLAAAASLLHTVLAQRDSPASLSQKKRVGLIALERVPAREHPALHTGAVEKIGEVTSGLLGPTGTRVEALVRSKLVPMKVTALPFAATRYHRG